MRQPLLPYLIIILLILGSALGVKEFKASLERQSTIRQTAFDRKTQSTPPSTSISSPTPSIAATASSAAGSTVSAVVPTTALSVSPTPIAYVPVTTQAIQLLVPFTVQAPDGDWVEPWKEGCEEAALLMADAFNKKDRRELFPPAEAKQKIADMVDWEIKRFGSHQDLGVAEMAIVAKEYLGYTTVKVKTVADLNDVKDEIRLGKPVIVPMAGRLLGNPYFRQPGPLYHVFLITGFEGDVFIANENGTKRGQNYRYTTRALNRAWHDHQDGVDITQTPAAYLVLEK